MSCYNYLLELSITSKLNIQTGFIVCVYNYLFLNLSFDLFIICINSITKSKSSETTKNTPQYKLFDNFIAHSTKISTKEMGHSNSTSPLIITQTNEQITQFNYSRLVQGIKDKKQQKKVNQKQRQDQSKQSYFKLNDFQCLNGDDLLVRERQNKIMQKFSSHNTTLRNISNHKLYKQGNSQQSRLKLTSIANLEVPQLIQPTINLHLIHKTDMVKFSVNQRIVCKHYIISKIFNPQKNKYQSKITNYFIEQEHMQNYISNLIKLKQVMLQLAIYEDFTISEEDSLYIVERRYNESVDFEKCKLRKNRLRQDIPTLIEYFCFLAKIYERIDGIYVDPQDVFFDDNRFYLADFKQKDIDAYEMILATLQLIFKNRQNTDRMSQSQFLRVSNQSSYQKTLEQCFIRKDQLQNSSSFPSYIRELWTSLVQKRIQRNQLLTYMTRLKNKAVPMSMKIDSFHACINHKKTWAFQDEKHPWIMGKKSNQIYFYNVNDGHRCQVKVIRKKKKIDLSQIKLAFDPEELQLKYVAQNSKLVVRISQFELQKSSSLSDIEIRHRLPVKFKNPSIFFNNKKQQLYILQNSVYKYSTTQNKIYQQTKKISDCTFLARSYDFSFMVVKMSIDIFRNGIRVFLNQAQTTLMFVGNESLLDEMSNIRVDIRSVEFCKQIYKGVYLMLANRNLWVLDLNFSIFFSYATIQRVKQFYGFASVVSNAARKSPGLGNDRRNNSSMQQGNHLSDYAFEIFNQPFKAEFLTHQQGLNIKVKDDQLHVIGQVQGNICYLKYAFLPQAGSLKLLQHKSLIGVDSQDPRNHKFNKQVPREPNLDFSNKNLQSRSEPKSKKRVRIAEFEIDQVKQDDTEEHKPHFDQQPNEFLMVPVNPRTPLQLFPRISNISTRRRVSKLKQAPVPTVPNCLCYQFNFHEQNLQSYKKQAWLYFSSAYLIGVYDFYLKTNKTNYEVQLQVQRTKCSLKDLIERYKKQNEGKSYKSRKNFSKRQILFYMLRCIDIYEWLVRSKLFHRNISISNLYFMEKDNSLKLIAWSEPPRNWYVSDYKDLLLVFFNIVTCNTFEKLTQKMLYKYKDEIQLFGNVYEKMQLAFRHMKVSQKKAEIEKQLKQIKQSLLKELAVDFLQFPQDNNQPTKQNKLPSILALSLNKFDEPQFVFNFEFNTPRFSMISIFKNKMKKMKCLLDQHSKEQLIFKSTDKHLWNESKGLLYVFTATYQFYEIIIDTTNFKEQALTCEEYQYLPNNILDSTFVFIPLHGIFSVGGVFKAKDTELTLNRIVYWFNHEKLTWDDVCEMPEPRVNPHLILSKDYTQLYCMGGSIYHSQDKTNILKMTFGKQGSKKYTMELLTDPLGFDPFSRVLYQFPTKIYNLSKQSQLFILFSLTNQKYLVRLFSLNSFCFDLNLDTKNYSDDNKIISQTVGITLNKGVFHLLRQYGKYAKINLNKLQSLVITNSTVYPEREDKIQS